MTTERLRNVSDTAVWVAQYRAMESDRPDALFYDPFARKLAGERGETLVRQMKVRQWDWPMIVRTAVMDEIILRTIERERIDCVLNLAAGLDARPYRLPLPKELLWVEADLPPMLAYKADTLAGETPVCRLESVPANLADAGERRALFARVGSEARRVLVVAEGLLVYLSEEEVGALARDLHAQEGFRLWLIDLASPRLLQFMKRRVGKHVDAAGAPFRFGPKAGTAFFAPHGWNEREFRSTFDEAWRLKRTMRLAWLWRLLGHLQPRAKREEMRRFSGIVLLERA